MRMFFFFSQLMNDLFSTTPCGSGARERDSFCGLFLVVEGYFPKALRVYLSNEKLF